MFLRIVLIVVLIGTILWLTFQILEYQSSLLMISHSDVNHFCNQTNQRIRIPRIIHQTYETHQVPSKWNATVNSVMEMNKNEFEYRRWSHTEMDEFVKKHEYEFYTNIYVKYRYQMQRIDSFRYVLMYYIGGIYVDMDNGCNRRFIDLLNTLENLDPNVNDIACFPRRAPFGVESDFIISSRKHPFYRQLISNLGLFNRDYYFHFWTMLASAGPVYVSIQKLIFFSSKESIIRLLHFDVFRPIFIRKENGLTWVQDDFEFLLYIGKFVDQIIWCVKRIGIVFIIFMLIKWFRKRAKIILK